MPHLNYKLQVSQPVVLQVGQELLPAMGLDKPPVLLERQAKVDITRFAVFWHWGQETSSSA